MYQLTQTEEMVEEMVQKLARIAFPSTVGKEYDCLLKGRFFSGTVAQMAAQARGSEA